MAPGMEVRGERLLRLLAFRRYVGGFLALCLTAGAPLLLCFVLPPLRARTLWLNPWLAGGVWVSVLVALIVWQTIGERRLMKQEARLAPPPEVASPPRARKECE